MLRKVCSLVCFLLLFCSFGSIWAFPLKVDIGAEGQPVKVGWQEFSGGHQVGAQYREFLVGGSTIGAEIRIGNGNESGYRNYGGGELGGDMVYPDDDENSGPVDGSVILTLRNLPPAGYTLVSYHNDSKSTHDPHGFINVTVSGAISASTSDLNAPQTQNSADDTNLGQSNVTFTASGAGDVVVTYAPVNFDAPDPRAVLSGFELELSGATIQFDSASSAALESVSPAVLTVTLSNPEEGQTYTVDYAVAGGTATAGADYIISGGGPACWSWPTQCHGDTDNSGDVKGSDFLALKDSWYKCAPDPDYNPCADFDRDGCVKGSDFLILKNNWYQTVEANCPPEGGSATLVFAPGEDGTLQFEPGQLAQYISIDIVDDALEEFPDETIEVTLSNPTNATLALYTHHTFAITDDEMPPRFTNSIGMEFVRIEPGTFTMGSNSGDPDEKPIHQVTIGKPFYMAVTEVTNAQYEQFDAAHSAYRATQIYNNGETLRMSTGDNEAVIYVSWEDANNFCQWLSNLEGRPYRLPNEAEWEYTCRAGTTSKYYTGDSLPSSYHKSQENSSWPDEVDLTVRTTGQNSWGLWDMHGNVEEWCYDWYGPYESGSQIDPVGRTNGTFKVSRGGSHNTPVFYLRSANRLSSLPEDKHWLTGFRVAYGRMPDTPGLPEPQPKQWATDVSQTAYNWPSEYETPDPYFRGPEVWVRKPSWAGSIPMYGHNHQPAVTFCDNGDILGAWYSCNSERGRELTVLASRLRPGNSTWDYPDEFFRAQDRNMHGTSLLNDRNGKLYLFNGLGTDYSWAKLALCAATSIDNGVTWEARVINPNHGKHHQVIAGAIKTREGYIIATGDANPGSAVHISRDNGQTFINPGANRPVPDFGDGRTGAWIAGIHCGLVQLTNGDLMAFGRGDNINDRMPKSISTDMGQNWTYSASPFQPVGGGQRCVLLRLEYSYGQRLGEQETD